MYVPGFLKECHSEANFPHGWCALPVTGWHTSLFFHEGREIKRGYQGCGQFELVLPIPLAVDKSLQWLLVTAVTHSLTAVVNKVSAEVLKMFNASLKQHNFTVLELAKELMRELKFKISDNPIKPRFSRQPESNTSATVWPRGVHVVRHEHLKLLEIQIYFPCEVR